MIESSKYNRENYPRKCLWTQERETRVKFNPGLRANRPSNNWAQEVLSQGAFHKWAVSFFAFLRGLSCPHFCCCCSNWSFSVWRSESFLEVSNPLHVLRIVLWKGDKRLHTRANVARAPSNCNLQSYTSFSHQLRLCTVRSKAVSWCLILSTCYEWKIYTFYNSYDWTSCVHSTDRFVEWNCMALVHSSFRFESCLVALQSQTKVVWKVVQLNSSPF